MIKEKDILIRVDLELKELIKKVQSIIYTHGSYWGDYFITLAFYHLQRKGLQNEANLLSDSLMDESFTLLKTQINWQQIAMTK